MWAVDTHVEVAPESTGIASLAVRECQWSADFSLPCTISALPHPCRDPTKDTGPSAMAVEGGEEGEEKDAGNFIEEQAGGAEGDTSTKLTGGTGKVKTNRNKIPVFVRRAQTGDLIEIIYVPCAAVCEECPTHFTLCRDDPGVMLCDLRGLCHVVCAVEQKVDLREATLVSDSRTEELSGPLGPW